MKLISAAACIIILAVIINQGVIHTARAEDACREGDRRVCGSDVGACESGRSVCKEGEWGECEGGVGPKDSETCGNSLDDNCDGAVDENCFPWLSFILVGMGILFICIGMIYIQKEKGERMLREGVGKD
jgi:tellurite resistance protein TehA-like permease